MVLFVTEPGDVSGRYYTIRKFFKSFIVFYVSYFYGQLGLSVHTAVSSVNGGAAGSTHT